MTAIFSLNRRNSLMLAIFEFAIVTPMAVTARRPSLMLQQIGGFETDKHHGQQRRRLQIFRHPASPKRTWLQDRPIA